MKTRALSVSSSSFLNFYELGRREDFNRADLGVVGDRRKRDVQRSIGDGRGERLIECCVLRHIRQDVEVGKDLLIVDRYVEHALAWAGPVNLGELEHDVIGAIRHTDGVREVAVTL